MASSYNYFQLITVTVPAGRGQRQLPRGRTQRVRGGTGHHLAGGHR